MAKNGRDVDLQLYWITFLLRILHLFSLLLEYTVTAFSILNTVVTIESQCTPVSY